MILKWLQIYVHAGDEVQSIVGNYVCLNGARVHLMKLRHLLACRSHAVETGLRPGELREVWGSGETQYLRYWYESIKLLEPEHRHLRLCN